jgi:hypothetical protein
LGTYGQSEVDATLRLCGTAQSPHHSHHPRSYRGHRRPPPVCSVQVTGWGGACSMLCHKYMVYIRAVPSWGAVGWPLLSVPTCAVACGERVRLPLVRMDRSTRPRTWVGPHPLFSMGNSKKSRFGDFRSSRVGFRETQGSFSGATHQRGVVGWKSPTSNVHYITHHSHTRA